MWLTENEYSDLPTLVVGSGFTTQGGWNQESDKELHSFYSAVCKRKPSLSCVFKIHCFDRVHMLAADVLRNLEGDRWASLEHSGAELTFPSWLPCTWTSAVASDSPVPNDGPGG
jgi:hypothetical protein